MKERNYSLDSLKFFCVLGVICRHYVPFANMNFGFPGGKYVGSIINTIDKVCVPIFFIISGYFFYKKYSKEYTKKNVIKYIKILLTWSVFYIIANICIKVIPQIQNKANILKGIVNYLSTFRITDFYYTTGIINGHLWYVTALIIVFLIMYVVMKYDVPEKALCVTLVLNIMGVMIPVLISHDLAYKVRDAIFYGSSYGILGVCISKYEYKVIDRVKKLPKFLYVGIIGFLFGVSIIERYFYNAKFNDAGDCLLSTIPLAFLIFAFCLVYKNILHDSIINKLGRNTLGIYLIHPFVITITPLLMTRFKISAIEHTIIWQTIYTPIVLIISFGLYSLIQYSKRNILSLVEVNSKNYIETKKI